MHMLQIEDTKVFTVVELKPKSIFRERGKHVKYVGFFFSRRRKEKRRPTWTIQILVSYLVY